MNINNFRQITTGERNRLEAMMGNNIIEEISDLVRETTQWLSTPTASRYFAERQGLINDFFRESGITSRWDDIIHTHAMKGVDIAEQIYGYARSINTPSGLITYNKRERQVLNNICDNQYELIRNVGQQEISGIRRCILEDVAEGVNPRQSSIFEVQLEPINGMSPERRAETIARTETARCINTATLQQFKEEGFTMVHLTGGSLLACEECEELMDNPIPIEEAMNIGVVHPNCRCAWVPVIPEVELPPLE